MGIRSADEHGGSSSYEDYQAGVESGVARAEAIIKAAAEAAAEMRAGRDAAYHERNQLVAYLSRIFPSHLAVHPCDPAWDPDWRNIVCIHSPAGMLTWHIHANEVPFFTGLGYEANDWDGHTTDEKYARLAKLGLDANGNNVGSLLRSEYDATVGELVAAWEAVGFEGAEKRQLLAWRVRALRVKLGLP